MPPAVGYAEASADMQKAMMGMKAEMIGQPHEMATVPAVVHGGWEVVKQPARTATIVKETAKFWKPLPLRLSSCLYPTSASRCSSRSRSGVVVAMQPST